MIEVTPSTAFMIYLATTLTILVLVWVQYHFRSKKKFKLPAETLLLVCEYCHCAYVEDYLKDVTQCPKCDSFNKNNAYQAAKPTPSKKKAAKPARKKSKAKSTK